MSIATRRGDQGETDLLFGRRVAKTDSRIEACGALDELNAALGLVRTAPGARKEVLEAVASFQADLVIVMGEVATKFADLERYLEKGFRKVDADMVATLDAKVEMLEGEFGVSFQKWAVPGAEGDPCGAALDFARTVCRRAERRVMEITDTDAGEDQGAINPELVKYVNRLSDVLWLLARLQED